MNICYCSFKRSFKFLHITQTKFKQKKAKKYQCKCTQRYIIYQYKNHIYQKDYQLLQNQKSTFAIIFKWISCTCGHPPCNWIYVWYSMVLYTCLFILFIQRKYTLFPFLSRVCIIKWISIKITLQIIIKQKWFGQEKFIWIVTLTRARCFPRY